MSKEYKYTNNMLSRIKRQMERKMKMRMYKIGNIAEIGGIGGIGEMEQEKGEEEKEEKRDLKRIRRTKEKQMENEEGDEKKEDEEREEREDRDEEEERDERDKEEKELLDYHMNLSGLFKMSEFFTNIDINETVLDEYADNFDELLEQLVNLIKNAVLVYEFSGLKVKNDNLYKSSDGYVVVYDSSKEKYKTIFNILSRSLIDFLRENNINVETNEIENIEYLPIFRESVKKYYSYRNKSLSKIELSNLSLVDIYLFNYKRNFEDIKRHYNQFLTYNDENTIGYFSLTKEIVNFIKRLNISLEKYGIVIKTSFNKINDEFLIKLTILK